MQQWIYDFGIRLYSIGISIASLLNAKAKLWRVGRKDWQSGLAEAVSQNDYPLVWIHAASLGEFEQGRPIIEDLRNREPNVFVLLTFFSPSGYEIRKNYEQADHVMYMPLDTSINARKFVSIAKPSVSVFIKYEFWFNHLSALNQHGGSVFLASGRFHAKQGFFQSWGGWFKQGLEAFDHFYLQDMGSAKLLDSIGIENYTVNGDTRFDRVIAIKEEAQEISSVRAFIEEEKCLVIGSSWPQEEALLVEHINELGSQGFKTIIAPHVIDEGRMREFSASCSEEVVRLSTWQGEEARVMFIDSIGLLARVYRYADLAFVGGAFGDGLHNVLEPSVWSVPVVFGPRFQGFPEAIGLLEAGAARVIDSQQEFTQVMNNLLHDEELQSDMGAKAGAFCRSHKGASTVVVDAIIDSLSEKIEQKLL